VRAVTPQKLSHDERPEEDTRPAFLSPPGLLRLPGPPQASFEGNVAEPVAAPPEVMGTQVGTEPGVPVTQAPAPSQERHVRVGARELSQQVTTSEEEIASPRWRARSRTEPSGLLAALGRRRGRSVWGSAVALAVALLALSALFARREGPSADPAGAPLSGQSSAKLRETAALYSEWQRLQVAYRALTLRAPCDLPDMRALCATHQSLAEQVGRYLAGQLTDVGGLQSQLHAHAARLATAEAR
jgi:hypothetical protein